MRLPPAIVLGIDSPIGLSIVRELGERGVEVHGVARDNLAVGLGSRWLAKSYLRRERDEGTVTLLNTIAHTSGAPFILTVSESDILFLIAHRDQLSARPLTPDARRMELALDKRATLLLAKSVGLATPQTVQVTAAADIDQVAAEARYPVVLKWANPAAEAPRLARAGLTLEKFEYCYAPDDLKRKLGRYAVSGRFPLVQTYCPGVGLGQMAFMHGGKALLRFQHRRVREWPPEGGTSTACMSLPLSQNSALFERSVALLQAMEWEGSAMVEYRHDPSTRESVLMEVNGRFWGSQALAYHAGAHFGWFTYSVLGLGNVPPRQAYQPNVLCRYMAPDIRRLWTILFRPKTIQNRALYFSRSREITRFFAEFLSVRASYFVFSWRDPGPWLHDMLQLLRKRSARIGRRIGRGCER